MKFSVVIIGLGNIGMLYDINLPKKKNILTHCNAFTQHPDFELIGAVEKNSELRSSFEAEYQLPSSADLESFISENNFSPDVFIIAIPTESHLSAINQIISISKPIGILCEKPLAYDLDEAIEINRLCKDNNIKLYINFMRRADPAILELKHRIHTNQIEAPYKLVAWYSKGLIHNGSHFIDLFNFFFGPPTSFKVVNPGLKKAKDAEPDFLLEFSSATIFFSAANADHFSHHKFELAAKNGYLTYQGHGDIIWKAAAPENESHGNIPLADKDELIEGDMRKYQYNVSNMLSKALNNRSHELCDGETGLKNIIMLHKIISSK